MFNFIADKMFLAVAGRLFFVLSDGIVHTLPGRTVYRLRGVILFTITGVCAGRIVLWGRTFIIKVLVFIALAVREMISFKVVVGPGVPSENQRG